MTWREGYHEWVNGGLLSSDIGVDEESIETFRAGAKWAANHLDENRVWESRTIIDELKERLEEE